MGAAKKLGAIRSKLDYSGDSDAAEERLLTDLVEASSQSTPKKYAHVPAGLTRDYCICLSNRIMFERTHSGYLAGEAPAALEDYNILLASEGDDEVELCTNGATSVTCEGCLLKLLTSVTFVPTSP